MDHQAQVVNKKASNNSGRSLTLKKYSFMNENGTDLSEVEDDSEELKES